jgi:hypothetical protein
MVDKVFPLKSFTSLIETSTPKAGHQQEVFFPDHGQDRLDVDKDCLDAMSSQDHELSSKYSASLQTTPFSVSDILSPFDESYRQHYARTLDSSSHYMGPNRYLLDNNLMYPLLTLTKLT